MGCCRSSVVVGEKGYFFQRTNLTTTTTAVGRRSKCRGQQSTLPSGASCFINPKLIISFRRRRGKVIQASNLESSSNSNAKIANLSARRKERVTLPNYSDESWQMYPISEFLRHPSGVETILNTKALQRFEPLDSNNTYRCTLPPIQLLKFEVAPVLDLRVTPTTKDCIVEMLSCEFEGSQAVKRHNGRFSAFMRNHITWDANCSEPCLNVDVNLNMSLEIYTQPFTMLPISAVEKPGNLIMQTLVDKLVPLLIQQLLQDYDKWVREQCKISL